MKSNEIAEMLNALSNVLFGNNRTKSITDKTCVMCGKKNLDFRDSQSLKEYRLSGMCQKCQDNFYDEIK